MRSQTHPIPTGRAARAAARVAARYAKAPTYSQMLAEDARAALRAAQAASQAAQEAHAAAQLVLEGLEAATSAESAWEVQASSDRGARRQASPQLLSQAARKRRSSGEALLFAATGDPQSVDLAIELAPVSEQSPEPGPGIVEAGATEQAESSLAAPITPDSEDFYAGSAAYPIHANLIQFPREMVATRKMRPRRAEGPLAAASDPASQLSIFEVDPGSISTQPSPLVIDEPAAPAWMRPEWPAVELEQPQQAAPDEPRSQAAAAPAIDQAPLVNRLLAITFDAALIVAAFLAPAAFFVAHVRSLPGLRVTEICAALVLLFVAAAYMSVFSTLTRRTPGMWYAGIALCTLDGKIPNRAQRCARLPAMLLSVLPLGLGVAWSLFDESNLTWHDRLSGTYLRLR